MRVAGLFLLPCLTSRMGVAKQSNLYHIIARIHGRYDSMDTTPHRKLRMPLTGLSPTQPVQSGSKEIDQIIKRGKEALERLKRGAQNS